ncbi:hypothetical protein SLS62_003362 [Diatrype stigma]|uniref:Uncharacterized protein n=1 Tax=Diatrype stigma TaxID=117547 RepID=A0AAN9YUA6_9PEZI
MQTSEKNVRSGTATAAPNSQVAGNRPASAHGGNRQVTLGGSTNDRMLLPRPAGEFYTDRERLEPGLVPDPLQRGLQFNVHDLAAIVRRLEGLQAATDDERVYGHPGVHGKPVLEFEDVL